MILCKYPKAPFIREPVLLREFPYFVSCHLLCDCLLSLNKLLGILITFCLLAIVSKQYKLHKAYEPSDLLLLKHFKNIGF